MNILANHPAMHSDNKPTDRQAEIAEFIVLFTIENGYSPALQDICDRFGFASKNGVADHIEALRKKGVLSGEPTADKDKKKASRGLVVIGFSYGDIFRKVLALQEENQELRKRLESLTKSEPEPETPKPKRRSNAKK